MVKWNSSTNTFDRTMYDYKFRTRYGRTRANIPPPSPPPASFRRGKPSKSNHVQVVRSKGCCSSEQQKNVPLQPVSIQQAQVPQITAHDRSHSRLDPPDPFYSRQGRVKKATNRTRKPYQTNQIHSKEPNKSYQSYHHYQQQQQPPTVTTKKNCCCTIL